MDFLSVVYFGNTLQAYLIALGIVTLSGFLGHSFKWIAEHSLARWVQKTETRVDDIILQKLHPHLISLIVLMGLRIAFSTLLFDSQLTLIIDETLFIATTFVISHAVGRFLEVLFEASQFSEDQFVPILRKAAQFAIWAIALILVLNHAGYNVTSLLAGLGLGGLAFAMASKDYVSNIFGGVTVFTDKTFHLKDRIRIGGHDGTIEEIGLRSTRLKTFDGTIVTIPNSLFTESMVENVSEAPLKKVSVNLKFPYETSVETLERVHTVLNELAKNHPQTEPESTVSVNNFDETGINVLFIFYIKNEVDTLKPLDAIHMDILRQFAKNKIKLVSLEKAD